MSDVITKVEGQVGRIRLNRPKAIHALTKDMCTAMIAALVEWRGDGGIQAVMIDHAEGRGFCAGGDVRMLAESRSEEHTSELQSLMRNSYPVFCLTKTHIPHT